MIAQLHVRNFQDCATLLAQLLGLRNSACATAFDRLRNSQDCATLQLHCLQIIPAPKESIELENDRCRHKSKTLFGTFTRLRWYQHSHPHGTSNWLGASTRLRRYQNSHSHGTSNWLGASTRLRWYQHSRPHGTSNWLGLSTRLRRYQNSHLHGTLEFHNTSFTIWP